MAYVYLTCIEVDRDFIFATSTSAVDDESLYGGIYTVDVFTSYNAAEASLKKMFDLEKDEYTEDVMDIPPFVLEHDDMPKPPTCEEAWTFIVHLRDNRFARQTYSIYKMVVKD